MEASIDLKQKRQIKTLTALLTRSQLASQLGFSYSGDRDLYKALGYDTTLTYAMMAAAYERQDIARAVIDRPVDVTWKDGFSLVETDNDGQDTDFERDWKALYDRLSLKACFTRLDRLTGIGTYGVLLLGLSDAKVKEDFAKEVQGVKHDLLYVRPFSGMNTEGSAQIAEWETDPSNERYGKPTIYQITINNLSTGASELLRVHYSRVLHIIDGQLESEIEGTPRLQPVWNRLKDLEKIVGGSAEMFWRGARPGYQAQVDPDFTLTNEMKDELREIYDEYEHNLRRIIFGQGVELKALASQVADPANHYDICIQSISAETGIPKRILTGSERGELASTQDRENWADLIEGRRQGVAEDQIIRPFVDRCIDLQIISQPKSYAIKWPDMRTTSDMDKVKLGQLRAQAVRDYCTQPLSETVLPPESFLRICLGLKQDEVSKIITLRKEEMSLEEAFERAMIEQNPEGGQTQA